MIYKKTWFWFLMFLLTFLLTQDYLWGQWKVRLGIFGLPTWLWWFVGVHLGFIILFLFFSRDFWQEPK